MARERAGRGGEGLSLTRTAIVEEALVLIDGEGVDGFSMRKLAARLSVSPQALYWHFKSKDDLCRAVVEHVSEDVTIELDDELPVAERVRALMLAMRGHLIRHPSITELGRRYLPAMAGETTSTGIGLMRELGAADDVSALRHYRALLWTVTGFALVEEGVRTSVHHTPLAPGSSIYEVQLREGGEAAGEPDPPNILDVGELFEAVVDAFVAGLEAVLGPRA